MDLFFNRYAISFNLNLKPFVNDFVWNALLKNIFIDLFFSNIKFFHEIGVWNKMSISGVPTEKLAKIIVGYWEPHVINQSGETNIGACT